MNIFVRTFSLQIKKLYIIYKMITLKTLHIENFMSIDCLDLEFSNNQITAITGQNGSGKSSLIYAVALALTGYKKGESYKDYIKTGRDFAKVILETSLKGFPAIFDIEVNGDKKKAGTLNRKVTYKGKTYLNSEFSQFIESEGLEELETLMFMFQGYHDIIDLKPSERANLLKKLFKFEFPEIVDGLKKDQEQYKRESLEQNAKIEELKEALAQIEDESAPKADLSLPGDPMSLGSRHPVSIVRQEIVGIFRKFGYDVAEGPEIEDDHHVFEALNFPANHPARDMQDTFFVSAGHLNPLLLRTHTSSVQVRAMETMPLPIRVVCPGRVFRNEAISARAHCIFHQIEGLYIDENVTFADMKQAILLFAREMFGPETQIRMRPSYFPFTEPSAEVDVSCNICHGKGCNICKGTGWLEILGCGMVDPNVLKASGIDPEKYSGFAFGMGLERIAMLKWQVNDLRHYFENDLRFLREFNTSIEV